jgi:hypothetical protein
MNKLQLFFLFYHPFFFTCRSGSKTDAQNGENKKRWDLLDIPTTRI